jgi:hypothetical protein
MAEEGNKLDPVSGEINDGDESDEEIDKEPDSDEETSNASVYDPHRKWFAALMAGMIAMLCLLIALLFVMWRSNNDVNHNSNALDKGLSEVKASVDRVNTATKNFGLEVKSLTTSTGELVVGVESFTTAAEDLTTAVDNSANVGKVVSAEVGKLRKDVQHNSEAMERNNLATLKSVQENSEAIERNTRIVSAMHLKLDVTAKAVRNSRTVVNVRVIKKSKKRAHRAVSRRGK